MHNETLCMWICIYSKANIMKELKIILPVCSTFCLYQMKLHSHLHSCSCKCDTASQEVYQSLEDALFSDSSLLYKMEEVFISSNLLPHDFMHV